MKSLVDFWEYIYIYATDFIINLANIFNLSYYEVNLILFGVIYPLLLVSSFVLFGIQRRRIKNAKQHTIKSRSNAI